MRIETFCRSRVLGKFRDKHGKESYDWQTSHISKAYRTKRRRMLRYRMTAIADGSPLASFCQRTAKNKQPGHKKQWDALLRLHYQDQFFLEEEE